MESTISKKLVVVGDGACGKTCLLTVFSNKPFPEHYIPTIFDNSEVAITVDGKQVDLMLHDTAGQEEYDRLRPIVYPETDVFLLCFNVDRYASLMNIQDRWLPEIQHHRRDTPYVLVANMTDLRNAPGTHHKSDDPDNEMVTKKHGQKVAEKIEAFAYVECSALTGKGVTEAFEVAARATLPTEKRPTRKRCVML